MNLDQATVQVTTSHQSQNQADMRLRGGWLILARTVWILLVTLSLAVSVADLPLRWGQLHTICVGSTCGQLLTSGIVQDLQGLHLSVDFFASYIIILESSWLLVWTALALLIFWRKSNDPVALLVALFLVLFPAAQGPDTPAAVGAAYPSFQVLTNLLDVLGWLSFLSFFFLFPDGHFVPRWAGVLLGAYVLLKMPLDMFHTFPFAETISLLLDLPLLAGMVGIGLISQIYRYRRISSAVQRQQTKWVVYGLVTAILLFTCIVVLGQVFFPAPHLIPLLGAYTAIDSCELLIPLSIGFSILRYRLWDIDIIINRTLVYGLLTASIVTIYVLVIVSLGTVFQAQGHFLISLLATGLIAVLFQPLRLYFQRGVNRLMFGERDMPYTVISRLGQRLEATLKPDAVLPTIVETVAQALKLPYTAITLKQQGELVPEASYGSPTEQLTHLPLVYQNEQIGELLLAPRTPGEAFTPADRQLLNDLVRQAGVAVHTMLLTRELQILTQDLQQARERLVSAREEERRRLRRDLHDGLGPQLSSQTLLLTSAQMLLRQNPDEVESILKSAIAQSQQAISDIRRLVYALRPPALDDLGLLAAIQEQLTQKRASGIIFTFDAPKQLPPLPAAVEVACYRIVQEAITNVVSHAHARNCIVHLTCEEQLITEIIDDGHGLPPAYRCGVGLNSMKERAEELGGNWLIEPGPDGGTRVRAQIPCR